MEKLQWIEIKNFRGIKYAKLKNFTDINVFIGKNNTGKSTVLEGIYLNLIGKNKVPLFFPSDFKLRLIEREIKLTHPWDLIYFKRKERRLNIYWCYNGELCEIEINTNITNLKFKPDDVLIAPDYAIKVSIIYLFPDLTLHPQFAKIVRNFIREKGAEAIKRICNFYREKLNMHDLEYIESDEVYDVMFIFKDKSLPISSLGDGIRISFPIIALLTFKPEVYVLIEEPEVHQHPKSLELIAEAIVYSAKNNNNQIFISTHSLEFLEMLLKKAKEENVDVNVYKFIELKDGELKYKIYKRDEALAGLEIIGYDLRQ